MHKHHVLRAWHWVAAILICLGNLGCRSEEVEVGRFQIVNLSNNLNEIWENFVLVDTKCGGVWGMQRRNASFEKIVFLNPSFAKPMTPQCYAEAVKRHEREK